MSNNRQAMRLVSDQEAMEQFDPVSRELLEAKTKGRRQKKHTTTYLSRNFLTEYKKRLRVCSIQLDRPTDKHKGTIEEALNLAVGLGLPLLEKQLRVTR